MYVGISPVAPPQNGQTAQSTNTSFKHSIPLYDFGAGKSAIAEIISPNCNPKTNPENREMLRDRHCGEHWDVSSQRNWESGSEE
jgi:hypothetical protein